MTEQERRVLTVLRELLPHVSDPTSLTVHEAQDVIRAVEGDDDD